MLREITDLDPKGLEQFLAYTYESLSREDNSEPVQKTAGLQVLTQF